MEYSVEFGKRLIEAAEAVRPNEEADRAVLYLSLLSCEISLKAALEHAGFSIIHLKNRSHKIHKLIDDVAGCSFSDSGELATNIRAKVVEKGTANGTVGTCLTKDVAECSQYPNQIRYGEDLKHYPPDTMLKCAKVVSIWCEENLENLER